MMVMMVTKQLRRMMRTIYLDTSRRLSLFNVCLLVAAGLSCWWWWGEEGEADSSGGLAHTARARDSQGRLHSYSATTSPLIFIGGHPRSGTTLMRAILDSHGEVRCGEESRIIPRMLAMRDNWLRNKKEEERLVQAGVDSTVIDAAISAFVLETIAKHGEPARVLCNKDPLTLKWGGYLANIFPNSKWIFMVRDGRAVIHSVITRKVTISGYKLDDPRQCLGRWNNIVKTMNEECTKIGPRRCMLVRYEELVLHPRKWISLILDFLDLPWEDSVLHHERNINQPGGVRVSNIERSSDQIIKPINSDALSSWVGFYDNATLDDMDSIAPMLSKMGYDPWDSHPSYGVPDGEVVNNTNDVHRNKLAWQRKAEKLLAAMDKRNETEE